MGKVNNALRMLAILRSREKVTRKELAEELEVSVREITRYKDDLTYAGVTINEIKGRYGGYVLDNNDYLLNLNLSKNEHFSLDSALEQLKGSDGCFYSDLVSSVNKIKAASKNNESYLKSKVYSKGIKIKANYEEEKKKWLTINDAVLNKRKIKITYINSNLEETTRTINPYGLFTYYGANYFIGKCELKNALRQFKVMRIKEIELLDERFESEEFNLSDYLDNTIGIFRGEKYELEMKVYYPYAQGFKEYNWVEDEEVIDKNENGYLIYKAVVYGDVELISWIMGIGRNCEVIKPEKLKKKLINEYKKILEIYK